MSDNVQFTLILPKWFLDKARREALSTGGSVNSVLRGWLDAGSLKQKLKQTPAK